MHSGVSPDVLTVGLVGLGGVAQEHMRGCNASPLVKMIAGADIDAARAQDAASRYGFTAYTDYNEMIEAEPLDIVCVLTPPALHLPVVEAAARKGCHVLCEKPVAPSLEDAVAMREAVQAAGVKFLFGATYRHLPAMIRARDMIRRGVIGEVRLCVEVAVGGAGADKAKALSAIHYPEGGPGGTPMGLVDHGVHLIDGFSWLTGAAAIDAFGRGNMTGKAPRPECATLTLENGVLVQLLYDEGTVGLSAPTEGVFNEGAGWNINGFVRAGGWDPFPTVISVYGSTGALRAYPYSNVMLHATTDGVFNVNLGALPQPNHFRTQIESFARSITEGAPLAATVEDGIASLQAILAIYQSAQERRVIDIPGKTA